MKHYSVHDVNQNIKWVNISPNLFHTSLRKVRSINLKFSIHSTSQNRVSLNSHRKLHTRAFYFALKHSLSEIRVYWGELKRFRGIMSRFIMLQSRRGGLCTHTYFCDYMYILQWVWKGFVLYFEKQNTENSMSGTASSISLLVFVFNIHLMILHLWILNPITTRTKGVKHDCLYRCT